MASSNHRITDFATPLPTLFSALSLLRNFDPVGPVGSKPFGPDKVQLSIKYYLNEYINEKTGSALVVPSQSPRHALWVACLSALEKALPKPGDREWVRKRVAFEVWHLTLSPESRTGDLKFKSKTDLAKWLGVNRRTLSRWIQDIEEDLERILVARGIIPEPDKYDSPISGN